MTPNWKRNGFKDKQSAFFHIISALKLDESNILSRGLIDSEGYSSALIFIGNDSVVLKAKIKKKKGNG